jgi:rhamnose utilization protein RhaD (predicted bifunctional aldolase and dehydrogenase)
MSLPVPPDDLPELAALSGRVGANPMLIQAAGGNTSVKTDDVMWIKASGTLLADALTRNVFVPVDLPAMRAALDNPAVNADQPAQFLIDGGELRPSIETSLHAVFPQRVVVHVHCVQTLAHAVRADAATLLAQRLRNFDHAVVPYAKPGANLARLVRSALGPDTDVVVLRNHGLIVAAESVADAESLLKQVVDALRIEPTVPRSVDTAALEAIAKDGWLVPDPDARVHQLALDEARMAHATGGSLYPDHVIFCGVGAETVSGDRLPDASDAPAFLIVPGKGVVMRADASSGAHALSQCLADVLLRVPADASLAYLTGDQNAELLDWDAEKYRRALNA